MKLYHTRGLKTSTVLIIAHVILYIMIASLSGNLIHTTDRFCILETSGVGYKVFASPETLSGLTTSAPVFLYIYTVVREDALELYGFKTLSDQDMFEKLIGISGIGPRAALAVLSAVSVKALRSAISEGDLSYLTKVSGIGKKTAEKILLELRDKIEISTEHGTDLGRDGDVILALESLGYSLPDAREAVRLTSPDIVGTANRIKEALKNLAK